MKLTDAKEKYIQTWGTFATNWGINRTMAQVHALLLSSSNALSTDEVMEHLQISRGNANMNLRALMDWGIVKKEIIVRNGINQEDAKKIVKLIKEGSFKVQAAIMDDIIRVTAKKIDDLQAVIQASKTWDLGLALQFVNMKN